LIRKKKAIRNDKKFNFENVISELPEILDKKLFMDPKSRFQEVSQEKVGITPSYRVVSESGPDHDKKFVVGVYLNDELVAEGDGASKQEAQKMPLSKLWKPKIGNRRIKNKNFETHVFKTSRIIRI